MQPVKIDNGRYRKFGFKLPNGLIHIGHDFDCPIYTEVMAVSDGEIIFSGQVSGFGSLNPRMPGGVIVIRHINKYGNSFVALYGHVISGDISVHSGDIVKKGQQIAKVGSFKNGNAFLPHLHFCIQEGDILPAGKWGYVKETGKWRSPLEYLEKYC